MANEDAPIILFTIYSVLMLVSLIAFIIWLVTGDVRDEPTARIMVIFMGIGYVASVFLMYRYNAVIFSFITFVLALAFMIANHIVSHMETEERVSNSGITYTEFIINQPALVGMIFGYVGLGIGTISYWFYYRQITETPGSSMNITEKGKF